MRFPFVLTHAPPFSYGSACGNIVRKVSPPMQLRNGGDLQCHCCPSRGSDRRAAFHRGVCVACREWLRRQVQTGRATEAEQVELGLILPAKPRAPLQWVNR